MYPNVQICIQQL